MFRGGCSVYSLVSWSDPEPYDIGKALGVGRMNREEAHLDQCTQEHIPASHLIS